jgi:plastocyanin
MHLRDRRIFRHELVGGMLLLIVGAAVAEAPESGPLVSQKGKRFAPDAVRLHPGEHVTIVNDDGSLVHDAYIDAPDLTFDSGEMKPGARAVITFPKAGEFVVLCGIHPKMKLVVSVH